MRRDIAPLLRDHLLTAAALLTRLPLPGHGLSLIHISEPTRPY